jgi:hypothetical protein
MIRGEPAIGRDQSREPRLYSVEPVWGPDHEAVICFCGQGSEAAGPFSQRHCSHSRMRIATTSDRHRLPGASNAVRCRTLWSVACCATCLATACVRPAANSAVLDPRARPRGRERGDDSIFSKNSVQHSAPRRRRSPASPTSRAADALADRGQCLPAFTSRGWTCGVLWPWRRSPGMRRAGKVMG